MNWRDVFGPELVARCEALCGSARLDDAAQALYDAGQTVKPPWRQLGDVTRSVWREYAEAVVYGDLA